MIANWTLTLNAVTPAETERASGLSVDLQRVWRRRGQLPDRVGPHARFDIFALAGVMVRYALTRRGVSPGDSLEIGAAAAPSVVWCALMHADGVCEVRGAVEDVDAFEAAYFEDAALIDRLAGVSQHDAGRYLVAFDDEVPVLENEPGRAIEASGAETSYVVSLEVLGARLAERVGKPLLVAQVGPAPGTAAESRRQVRRLMRGRSARPLE